jgi:hypothetical protein
MIMDGWKEELLNDAVTKWMKHSSAHAQNWTCAGRMLFPYWFLRIFIA